MSNRISLTRIETKHYEHGGLRLLDHHAIEFWYADETLPDVGDDLELLRVAVSHSKYSGGDIFARIIESESGISIDGTFYDFDQVKDIINGS